MRKIALITAAALMMSAGTYALAQGAGQGAPNADQAQQRQERRGLSQDEYNRLVDARIASIKAGLKLSADQERLWGPVETAIRTAAADRFSHFQQRGTMREDHRQNLDAMQRLEMRSAMMTQTADHMSALAKAARPLWDSFSEEQKRIAPRLMRLGMGEGPMGWRERGDRHGRGEHWRMGMMDKGQGHGMGQPHRMP